MTLRLRMPPELNLSVRVEQWQYLMGAQDSTDRMDSQKPEKHLPQRERGKLITK